MGENFNPSEKLAIARRLGFLPMLFKITPEKYVIRALIKFWDPYRVVFAFKDFELIPTLEEICYFTSLKYQGRGQIFPHTQLGKKFLRYLGLKNDKKLRCLENNWDKKFFEGCNLLLQMWAMEQFYQRKNMEDIFLGNINQINNFYDSMRRFHLASRTGDEIQWKYPLLSHSPAYITCRRFYYIELIFLKRFQPYAPVRVLQQISEISIGPNFHVPRARDNLHEWNNIMPIDIGNELEREIPDMSPEGEKGFEDIWTTIWIRHSYLGTKVVTPEIWAQMENIMQYLNNAGERSSDIGASSSLSPPTRLRSRFRPSLRYFFILCHIFMYF
ncbi:hypothetical protein R3W88_031791 [Solanum pinnatisectum]|uniref:DUF7745 domain-containing protein n=1 Tax=Solanum pinnatisectum TaxID=50273 RepID=A0AAV9LQT8_9SOLN|nr:hypothetical protein R3W88_031791 [Solanum pinnatisectum]